MAESAISLTVKTIGSLLIEEGNFLHGVKDQVLQLQRELEWIQWFLKDADAKMIYNEEERNIQPWILGFKDVAYDAGDLLKKYSFKVGSRRRDGGFLEILSRSASIMNDSYLRHTIGLEIQGLNTRILILKNNFQAYGVRHIMEKKGSSSTRRSAYSFVEDENFVGLQDDVNILVKHLVSRDRVRVVSISGMGGLGKTTLANKVYNHPSVKKCFSKFAWIRVSQQWRSEDILRQIMNKLVPEKREDWSSSTEDELITQICEIQKEMRCLIALDDAWSEDVWKFIKNAFPAATQQGGSKILITTRKREVALRVGPHGFHHQPRLLSEDESWDLLGRKTIHEINLEGHWMNTNLNELERLGKNMVKHCAGLPLAVIVLGGILSSINTLRGWETVHQNTKSYLWNYKSIGRDKGDLERILALSYHDLPFQLKPCFLYLGFFPEDIDIDATTLYQLWIAEDMVLREDRVAEESMMELAERYLGELVHRGMAQLEESKLPGIASFRSCRLHPLMRDLCLLKAEEENFLRYINYCSQGNRPFDSLSSSSISKPRRLVIDLDANDVHRYTPPRKEIRKSLRMLQFVVKDGYEICNGKKTYKYELKNLEMLHVLSIEGLSPLDSPNVFHQHQNGWELPKSIGKLYNLRYLSLKDSLFLRLPSSLENLKYLQTLDLRLAYKAEVRIPDILWKMKELTSLYLPYQIKMPSRRLRLDGLHRLEILENFRDDICYTEDLFKLSKLRVLVVYRCWELENLAMIANYAQSSIRLQHVSLTTSCDFCSDKEKGLMVLIQLLLGRNIHHLRIWWVKWKFPTFESNRSSSLFELFTSLWGLDVQRKAICWASENCHRPQFRGRPMRKFNYLPADSLKGKVMIYRAVGTPQFKYTAQLFSRLGKMFAAARNHS